MASITLKNITKVYDQKVKAVKQLNLEIMDHEFLVLVGPSGCGKSTLLRMIAGLEEISSGELQIDGIRHNETAPGDRDIAMVFQSYALYPHMTAYQNMAFGLVNRKVPKEEIDRRVREAAEILDITELLSRKPKAMSGGQRQRVALGRALVREPAVFLLDEPLSNLDAKLRSSMRTEIIKLHQRLNTTFIYVTHDQTEAMTMGDRIVVMKDGKIQQVGTPRDLFNHPVNQFVAGFLGTPQMNFLDTRLDSDRYLVLQERPDSCGEIRLSSYALPDSISTENDYVRLGIRPEHILISASGMLTGEVEVVETLGSESYLSVRFAGEQLTIKVGEESTPHQGASVRFSLRPDKLHLFAGDSGRSLM